MKKLLVLFFVFIFLSGCGGQIVKKTRLLLGTSVEITVADYNKDRRVINGSIEKAFAEIERIEALLSRFSPESDISRINRDAYIRTTKVAFETIGVIEKAVYFSQLSNGAFDITVYPLTQAWGVGQNRQRRIPETAEIKKALDKVGYQHIKVIGEEQSIFLDRAGMSLDLGGIAKGYAVDRAIAVLKQQGIKSALVNAGGDIYCLGRRDKERKWRVGVQDPRKKRDLLTSLEVEDKAVASSGDYQNYIEIDSKRYGHILNPKSGYPCQEIPASVTILAGDCLTADALATCVFVLGPEKGMDLINQLQDTEAIVASVRDGKLDIRSSQGLEGKIVLSREGR